MGRSLARALFGVSEEWLPPLVEQMRTMGFPERLIGFGAFVDGKMVASWAAFLSDKIAGIYWVATLPEYRKKGIGLQVTLAPLLHAREKGCALAVLQATTAGESVYKKLGFREHCRLGRYLLQG